MSNHLTDLGHDVSVFCVNDTGKSLYDSKVNIIVSSESRKYNYKIISDINNAVIHSTPEIIHTWLPASITIPTMFIAYHHKKPCIFSFRSSMYFHRYLSYLEYITALFLSKKIVSNNDISLSKNMYRTLYNFKNGCHIPNIVSVKKRKSNTNPLSGCFKLIFAGRLDPNKNLKKLLEALTHINNHEWKLSVFGEGYLKEKHIKYCLDNNLSDKVDFYGYSHELDKHLLAADILIFPSFHEGMPNVLLEALSVGTPSVYSNIKQHQLLLSKTLSNLMFDPHSYIDIKNKILYVMDNYKRVQRQITDHQTHMLAYSYQQIIPQYLKAYNDTINEYNS